MSIGIRSIAFFESIQAFRLAISLAESKAASIAKINIMYFLRTDPNIPRKTGRMMETAIESLLSSAAFGKLDLQIVFSTAYSQYVENETYFIEKIMNPINNIVKEAIKSAYNQAGIDVTVI